MYQECLARELAEQEIPFEEKPRLRLEYKGRPLKQEHEPDFLCSGNLERVVFGFFIILALALNLAFVAGEIHNPAHHNPWRLFSALIFGLITSGLKLGDRSQLGALVLAASLVANLLLMIAVSLWAVSEGGMGASADPDLVVTVVSPAYGALAANAVSVTTLVSDTLMSRR